MDSYPVSLKAIAGSVVHGRQLPVDGAGTRVTKASRASPSSSPRHKDSLVGRRSDDAVTPRSQRDDYDDSICDGVCFVETPASTTREEDCSHRKHEDCCDSAFPGPSSTPAPSPFAGYPSFRRISDSIEVVTEELISSLVRPTSVGQPARRQLQYFDKLRAAQALVLDRTDLSKIYYKYPEGTKFGIICKYDETVLEELELPMHLGTREFKVDLEVVDVNAAQLADLMKLSQVEHVQKLLLYKALPNKKLLLAWEHMDRTVQIELETWKAAEKSPPTTAVAVTMLNVVESIQGAHTAGYVHGVVHKSTVGTSTVGTCMIKQEGFARKMNELSAPIDSSETAAPEVSCSLYVLLLSIHWVQLLVTCNVVLWMCTESRMLLFTGQELDGAMRPP